jgi:hypothetical protein
MEILGIDHAFAVLSSPTHHKNVILSGAPHSFIADTVLDGAESKDPEDAYLTHAARSFSTIEARTWRTRHGPQRPKPHLAEGRILLRQSFQLAGHAAVLVTFLVLFQSFFYAADHGLGVEFGADDFVGAVTIDGDAVIAHKGNVLIRIYLLDFVA